MELLTRRYRTTQKVIGPLLFVERATRISIGEMVRIILSEGDEKLGQVIEVSEEHAVIQMLEETTGVSIQDTDIYFTGSAAKAALSLDSAYGNDFTDKIDALRGKNTYSWVSFPL